MMVCRQGIQYQDFLFDLCSKIGTCIVTYPVFLFASNHKHDPTVKQAQTDGTPGSNCAAA